MPFIFFHKIKINTLQIVKKVIKFYAHPRFGDTHQLT